MDIFEIDLERFEKNDMNRKESIDSRDLGLNLLSVLFVSIQVLIKGLGNFYDNAKRRHTCIKTFQRYGFKGRVRMIK